MNIYSKHGDKVIFLNQNGLEQQRDRAIFMGLIPLNVYTVNRIEVGSWSSQVELIEFPDLWLNTVMFDDYKPNGIERAGEIIDGD
jgi:hypothetical protein